MLDTANRKIEYIGQNLALQEAELSKGASRTIPTPLDFHKGEQGFHRMLESTPHFGRDVHSVLF